MKKNHRIYWLGILLLATLACQATGNLSRPTPTTGLMRNSKAFSPPPSPTPSPTLTLTPTEVPPTPTPTATHTPSPTPTIQPTPSELQLQVFDELWTVVQKNYLYPDFNGLDWDAVREEIRPRVLSGMTEGDFYSAMEDMINRLGDDHSAFLRPVEADAEEAEYAGENDFVGIGVLTNVVPERQRAVILIVFPGSPAEESGLQPHDSILTVDGEPLVDERGLRRDLLRGPEGTTLDLVVQTPGQEPRSVTLTRRRVTGSTPVPYSEFITPQGKRIGYILLVTFADETIDNQVEDALRDLTSRGPLDGVILDNRQNGGGSDSVTKGVLGYFLRGSLGHFYDRDQARRSFNVTGVDINGSLRVPLVVLVGKGTVSFGEISSGVLKDSGRAYLIGETTDGNVELLWGFDFKDGSRAWIAHENFRPKNHPDDNWELTGIIPDEMAPSEWDLVTDDTDPAILASLKYFDGLE